MKIINSGGSHRVFGESLQVYDQLPAGTYNIIFNPMTGYSLERRTNLEAPTTVYGNHRQLAEKVVKRYQSRDSNFGTILGGRKGTGKTLTARLISNLLLEAGIPTIMVTEDTPGLSDFLASIEQPVLVFFDEFEKTFPYEYKGDDNQQQFLGLLDGIVNNRHFYLVTINDYSKLNPYFLGRTGRFYYNIPYASIAHEEIAQVVADRLTADIDQNKLTSILHRIDANYDQMTAIIDELNYGETIASALTYLNLELDALRRVEHIVKLTLTNGHVITHYYEINPLEDEVDFNFMDTINVDGVIYEYDFRIKFDIEYVDGALKAVNPEIYHNYKGDELYEVAKITLAKDLPRKPVDILV